MEKKMKNIKIILAALVVCFIATEKSYGVDENDVENSSWSSSLSRQHPIKPLSYSDLEQGFSNGNFRKGFLLGIHEINLRDLDVELDISKDSLLNALVCSEELINLREINFDCSPLDEQKQCKIFIKNLFKNKYLCSLTKISAKNTDLDRETLDVIRAMRPALPFIRDMQQLSGRYDGVSVSVQVEIANTPASRVMDSYSIADFSRPPKDIVEVYYRVGGNDVAKYFVTLVK
jgi:hypothetical protein